MSRPFSAWRVGAFYYLPLFAAGFVILFLTWSTTYWYTSIPVMLAAVFAGTYCGKLLLGKLPEKWFRWLFKGLITVLAVRMLAQALL